MKTKKQKKVKRAKKMQPAFVNPGEVMFLRSIIANLLNILHDQGAKVDTPKESYQ